MLPWALGCRRGVALDLNSRKGTYMAHHMAHRDNEGCTYWMYYEKCFISLSPARLGLPLDHDSFLSDRQYRSESRSLAPRVIARVLLRRIGIALDVCTRIDSDVQMCLGKTRQQTLHVQVPKIISLIMF